MDKIFINMFKNIYLGKDIIINLLIDYKNLNMFYMFSQQFIKINKK